GVVDIAVPTTLRIEIGLRDGVGRVVGGVLARSQRDAADVLPGQRIGDGDARQGDVAGVGDDNLVIDHVASGVRRLAGVAVDVQEHLADGDVRLVGQRHFHAGAGLHFARLVGPGGGRVVDITVAATLRIQIGLRDGVAGVVGLVFSGRERDTRDVL